MSHAWTRMCELPKLIVHWTRISMYIGYWTLNNLLLLLNDIHIHNNAIFLIIVHLIIHTFILKMMKHENYKANTHFINHVRNLTYVPHTHCPLVFFTPEFHYTAPITYLGTKWGMFTHLHRSDGKFYMKLTINTNGVFSILQW